MKILFTGGAGFQGSHLVERLFALGHQVTVLNTPTPEAHNNLEYIGDKAEIVWGSITDSEVVEKMTRQKDLIFHLGARVNVDESILDSWGTLEVNIRGTFNVLEAARKHNVRLINVSTCEVYGEPVKVPIAEDAELRPHSPYAASKAGADRLCFAYFKTYNLPVTIIRFFNIYGERQKEARFGAVIPIFTGQALSGGPIKVFGTGEQTRDYLHISDVVRAYEDVLNHPELAGEVINFGSGTGTKIKDIAEYIAQKMNVPVVYTAPRPGEATEMIADYSKAKRLLGWTPAVKIYEGIDQYIAWRKAYEHPISYNSGL